METEQMESVYNFPIVVSSRYSRYFLRDFYFPVPFKKISNVTKQPHAYVIYDKHNANKPIGVLESPLDGRIVGIDGEDCVYVLFPEESTRNSFRVTKFTLEALDTLKENYYPKSLESNKNERYTNIQEYFASKMVILTETDTVAILPIYNVCEECIDRVGRFLGQIQKSSDSNIVQKFIILGENDFQIEAFFTKYSIVNKSAYMIIDNSKLYEGSFGHPGSMALLLRNKNEIKIENIYPADLGRIFNYISKGGDLVGETYFSKRLK